MENYVTRFIIDGQTYVIPDATESQKGFVLPEDYVKLKSIANSAQVNVLEGVQVNGKALAIANKLVNILITSGSSNGSISVQGVNVPVKGLAALAYKADVSKTDLNTALQTLIDSKAATTTVSNLSKKIDIINGTGVGSIKKSIDDAFNEFATNVSDDGVVNSFKELVDWVASHGSEAAEMSGEIANLKALFGNIGADGEPYNVVDAIDTAIRNLNIDNYYTKTETASNFLTTGTAQTVTGTKTFKGCDIVFSDSATTTRQIRFTVGNNDYARIAAGATETNAGWMEIATADDGNEPIYVRQYRGTFSTVNRTLTLLDASGNTTIPGALTMSGTLTVDNASIIVKHPNANGGTAKSIYFKDSDDTTTFVFGSMMSNHVPQHAFIGWTDSPWLESNCLAISESKLKYKNQDILHTGNFTDTLDGRYIVSGGDTMTGVLTLTSGSGAAYDKTALSFIKTGTDTEQARIGTDVSAGLGLYATGTIYLRPNVDLGKASTNGIALSSTIFTYNGNNVLHTGNYATTLDARYVNASGDTMTGKLWFGSSQKAGISNSNDHLVLSAGDGLGKVAIGATEMRRSSAVDKLDLGSSAYRWGKVYAGGADFDGNVNMVGALTINTGGDAKITFNNTDGEKYTRLDFCEAGERYSYISAWDSRFQFPKYIEAPHFVSTVGTGTAPLQVASTTAVTNLNADMVDGLHASNLSQFKQVASVENWKDYVILLWKLGTPDYRRLDGKLLTRADGASRYALADVDLWHARWRDYGGNHDSHYKFITSAGPRGRFRLVTCTYEGEEYLAIQSIATLSAYFYFMGTQAKVLWRTIAYRSQPYTYDGISHAEEILNQEINDSIKPVTTLATTYHGSIYPDTNLGYNIGSSSSMFNRTYTRYLDTQNSYALRIATCGVERMIVGTSGNVGIGTDVPDARLHVNGTSHLEDNLTVGAAIKRRIDENDRNIMTIATDAATNINTIIYGDENEWAMLRGEEISFQNVTGATVVKIKDGKVGIGTMTPTYQLHVSGTKNNTRLLHVNGWAGALRFDIAGTKNSNAYLSSDTATNAYLNAGGNTLMVWDGATKSIRPSTSMAGQVDLGTSLYRWKNGYFKESCCIGNAQLTCGDDNILKINGIRVNQKSYTPQLESKPTASNTIYNDPDTGVGVAFQEGQCAIYPTDEAEDGYGISIVKAVARSESGSVVRVYWHHITETEKRLRELENTVKTIKENIGLWVNDRL